MPTTIDPRAFLKISREDQSKRPVEERRRDWLPIQKYLETDALKKQATRCMGCGVPFCQSGSGCPLSNLIPDWNDLLRRGQLREALNALHETNNFPEFTGILCPAPCESACVLDLVSQPVTIRNIELGIIDYGFEQGWVEPRPAQLLTGKRVAIIGSGPAGLAAAQQLVRKGHEVVVYEKAARIGGLLRYGIPDFKLDKAILDRRLKQMEAEGVRFYPGVEIGKDLSLELLQSDFDAICLAVGAGKPRDIRVPGRELSGIHFAMDFLIQQNRLIGGEDVCEPIISARDKRVVILGGGDTGSDCLGTALRQGAKEVIQLELLPKPPSRRSDQTPWPHWPMRLVTSHAHEEGGRRDWSVCTVGFTGKDGWVTGVQTQKAEIVDGQLKLSEASAEILDADLVLLAIGFTGVELGTLASALPFDLDQRGNIATNTQYATSTPGIFASGDARRGASLIVWAIAEGRKMAQEIDLYLQTSAKPSRQQGSKAQRVPNKRSRYQSSAVRP